MKKIALITFLSIISIISFSQTYRYGDITRETHDEKWHLINTEVYAYNVSVTVNDDKSYSIVCKTVGYGIDSYTLKYVKTTGKGAKYHDDIKGDFYLEDNLEAYGGLRLTNVENKNYIVLVFSNLKKQKEDD